VPDHLVRKTDPTLTRDHSHEILLDLACILGARQFKSSRNPEYVGVNDDTFSLSIPGTEDYIRRLPSRARNAKQRFHRVRDLSAESFSDPPGRSHNRFRFIAKEPGALDHRLDHFRPGGG